MADDVMEETVEETGDSVVDEFLNGGMPEGVDDEETPEEVPTEETTDGPTRDEQGRFVKKAEGEAPVEAAGQDTAAPAEAVTPEAPKEELPFTVKVSGQEYGLDGAKYVAGEGLYIPDQHYGLVRQLISEGAYYKQNWKTLESQAEQKGFQRAVESAPEVQQAKALSKVIDELFNDPEKLAEAYNNWHTMGPMYREKAMREMAERQLNELRQGSQREQETRQSEALEVQKSQALSETIGELKAVPDLKVLTPEDWQHIDRQIATLSARGGLFVTKEDGTYLDTNAIEEIAAHVLAVRRQTTTVAKKAEEAAQFNAANKPKAQAKAPVTTPRKGSAPKSTVSVPDKRDTLRDFLSGKLDDDE